MNHALNPSTPAHPVPVLPLTVQVGFAGPRRLWPEAVDPGYCESVLRNRLKDILASLPRQLQLSPNHFITGVSQVAAGADMLFTEAMDELGWLQRVVLPQALDDYLHAQGTDGPDFTPAERDRAESLLASARIVEVTVASTAHSRTQRFEQTNLRLLDECDLLVILRIDGAAERPGGTAELLRRARLRSMRLAVLTLRLDAQGHPEIDVAWEGSGGPAFSPPQLPECLQRGARPLPWTPGSEAAVAAYVDRLKQAGSALARQRQRFFRYAATVVVGTHIAATALALVALKVTWSPWAVLLVLALELALLATGFVTHRRLHHDRATYEWAIARLCAEVGRSLHAVRGLPMSLPPMQVQMFPAALQPLVRTLSVLHLHACRLNPQDWTVTKVRYLNERVTGPEGQVAYYERESRADHAWADRASTWFTIFSGLAFAATLAKFAVIAWQGGDPWQAILSLAGPLGILLPVVAVGVMSVAAAFDLEGRAHTFRDTLAVLRVQSDRLQSATTEHEFVAHVLRTEARLMAETLGWVGRRVYLGIS